MIRTRLAGLLAAVALVASAPRAEAKSKATLTLWQADTVAASPAGMYGKVLQEWARSAPLDQIVYVLRRGPEALRANEPLLVEAALRRAPASRKELRARLMARMIAADPKRARELGSSSASILPITTFPAASTFRIGLLAPSEGDYVDDSRSLVEGFSAGLGALRTGELSVSIEVVDCGRDDAAGVADAFDRAARHDALICGGLAPGSSTVLASASRWSGIPVLFPATADVGASSLSPRAWEIGPSGESRGAALAKAVLKRGHERVAILTSSARDTGFASGFTAECRRMGSEVVLRQSYAAGNATFTYEIRSLLVQRVTLLFWDGEPNEAAALLKQLTRERVSLRICGGEALAPELHHKETRVFLEGVMYVAQDWSLDSTSQAALARQNGGGGGGANTSPATGAGGASGASANAINPNAANDAMFVRGFLAGQLAAAALASRPLAPEELVASLEKLSSGSTDKHPSAPGARRMIPVPAELSVYTVANGRSERFRE